MKTPVIFKVAGIITLIQIIFSFLVGLVGALQSVNDAADEISMGDTSGKIILGFILIAMLVLIISSILLILGKKNARIIYLIGVVINLIGNIYIVGVECGILSSFITIVLCILLYTNKNARDYCSKNNNE